jgi:glyoxylase-like metal-dependent hydrolase (beta-lactamase superfamily II)
VVDPGDEVNTIMDYIEENKLTVKDIFLTHGHFDHTRAAYGVAQETGAPIWINKKDAVMDGKKNIYKFRFSFIWSCFRVRYWYCFYDQFVV